MRYLTPDQIQVWDTVSVQLRAAREAIDNAFYCALLSLPSEQTEKLIPVLQKLSEELSGLPYLSTPQSEWMGGDSTDPKNFKYRPPHIAR